MAEMRRLWRGRPRSQEERGARAAPASMSCGCGAMMAQVMGGLPRKLGLVLVGGAVLVLTALLLVRLRLTGPWYTEAVGVLVGLGLVAAGMLVGWLCGVSGTRRRKPSARREGSLRG